MAYRYSNTERANLKWFENDATRASLKSIRIEKGEIRGLKKLVIDFHYPITAIAGKNGCGKSTVLALSACAFHNTPNGWKLPDRKTPYFTFSDFFIQADGEVSVDGMSIGYLIHHNNWAASSTMPSGVGIGLQRRRKAKAGRWNDYAKRVDRPVAFFGIERVVPPAEKSVLRSHRYNFSSADRSGFEEAVCESVSKVLSVPYETFEFRSHGKYRLPWVRRKRGASYSGFNMGAGEKALFELFAAIISAPEGTLFLIDEIELGLHEQAQKGLIRELTELSLSRKVQVICTTHSTTILENLPPEGRIFIESMNGRSSVIPAVSPAFAAGRLSGQGSNELSIYVEDEIAAELVKSALPLNLSSRVTICPIGSHTAIISAMAVRFRDQSLGPAIAVLDGDQRIAGKSHRKKFSAATEGANGSLEWLDKRLFFLPSESSPEAAVLGGLLELPDDALSSFFRCASDEARDALDAALLADDHSEIYTFSQRMHMDQRQAWTECCRLLYTYNSDFIDAITEIVESSLIHLE